MTSRASRRDKRMAVPFDHNDHYHRMLLRHLPRGCHRALDVGCGTGRFARRLAASGMTVDAVDASPAMIRQARATAAASVRFWQADITSTPLPVAHYDVITCLASLHHMPFDTVTTLRAALAPGGVLLVLGCYREQWPADIGINLIAVPLNMAARLAGATQHQLLRTRTAPPRVPVTSADMTFTDIRRYAAKLLPGSTVRRLLFWRYLLRFQH